jgi:hypothetical protein
MAENSMTDPKQEVLEMFQRLDPSEQERIYEFWRSRTDKERMAIGGKVQVKVEAKTA